MSLNVLLRYIVPLYHAAFIYVIDGTKVNRILQRHILYFCMIIAAFLDPVDVI